MTGALAHLASLRQPLAAIWVSLSVQSSKAPRTAEVVKKKIPSLTRVHLSYSPPNLHTSAFFFFLSPIHANLDQRLP